MNSAVSYRATVTFSGPSLDIVPGQTGMSDEAEVSFGTWMKGDTGAPGATGATGATGPAGADGQDGHTPVIAATKLGKKTTVTSDGTAVAEIMDGNDGAPGPNQVNAATDSDITGLLKGASGKVARAVPGTDYVAPESGKGLSSNDYTSAEKARLASLHNYDDTALAGRVSTIEGKEAGWDGKYSKPSSGIPSSDMSETVRTSLGKADSALQSVPSTYRTASEQDDIDGELQLQLDEIFDDANANDYEELPKLCGQPMMLFGAGTPQEAIVPVNWKQFADGGYNWNGLPSAKGQVYINTSASSNGRYTGCPKADGTLEWKNF